ncbi:Protein of unknown function (DUF3592) [Burkholderia sp. Ch1-1]|nr:Protein of unknown function (DUF3592) [Burkholderia sp. Ch1-1]
MPLTDEVLMRRFKVLIFSIFWIGCLIGLAISIDDTKDFLYAAVKAPGRVVPLNARGSHPQIEYVNKKGERVSYPQGGWIAGYKVGDRVTVLYLEYSPNPRPTIGRVGAIWFPSILLTAFVVGIPAIGLFNLLIVKFPGKGDHSKWRI